MEQADESLYALRVANSSVKNLVLQQLNEVVLNDSAFFYSPGGTERHHQYKHGLVIHVAEVMSNILRMTSGTPGDALISAVIWHDFLKIREYALDSNGETVNLAYRKMIGHVAGSAMEFYYEAHRAGLSELTIENILHLLLSHHGCKEWGSPAEPQTAEAFLLHAADNMSAYGVNL